MQKNKTLSLIIKTNIINLRFQIFNITSQSQKKKKKKIFNLTIILPLFSKKIIPVKNNKINKIKITK